jgi:hypothetical protein
MKSVLIVVMLLMILPTYANTYHIGNAEISLNVPEPNKIKYSSNDALAFNTLEGPCGITYMNSTEGQPLEYNLMKTENMLEYTDDRIITVLQDGHFRAHIPNFILWSDMNLTESLKFFKSVSVRTP